MKKTVSTLLIALMAIVIANAQQISVVLENGQTSLHHTFQDAIERAEAGSVIYLPGGGFSIDDSVKITKRVTIIGIGHKSMTDNVDGITIITGNIFFNEGSSSSAILGCYITGNINIGEDGLVKNILVKYCNLNSIQVLNADCRGTVINQNYVRGDSNFGGITEVSITNNVISKICNITSGEIKYNVVCYNNYYNYGYGPGNPKYSLDNVNNTIIANNIFRYGTGRGMILSGSNCSTYNNFMESGSWGDHAIVIDASIEDILCNVNDWTISPKSDFHFKEAYKQYEGQVGVYSDGAQFDYQLAPVPFIVAKRVDDQTDAAGMLNIKIRVKAGE